MTWAAQEARRILDEGSARKREVEMAPVADVVPITRSGAPWPTMEREAFYGIAGEFVRLVSLETEADPAALLVQFLALHGSMIGRASRFNLETTDHYANIFAVFVGKSSKARRDTARKRAEAVFRDLDPTFSMRVVEGLSSGEGLIWNVRDPIWKLERDKRSGITEEVLADPGVEDERLLVTESELAGVLKVVERHGNTLSPIVRRA